MVVPHSPRQRSRLSVVSAPQDALDVHTDDDTTTSGPESLPDSLSGMVSTRAGTASKQSRGRAGASRTQPQELRDDAEVSSDHLRSRTRSPFSMAPADDQAAPVGQQHSTSSAAASSRKPEQTSTASATQDTININSSTGSLQVLPMHSRAQQLVNQRAGWGALAARPLPLTTAAAWQGPSPWSVAARTLAQIAAEAPGAAAGATSTCLHSPHPALDSLSALTGMPRPAAAGMAAMSGSSSSKLRSSSLGGGGPHPQLQSALGAPAYGGSSLGAPSQAVTAVTRSPAMGDIGGTYGLAAAGRSNNSSLAAWQAQQFRQLSHLPTQLLEHGVCLRQKLADVGRQQQQLWQPTWRGQQRLTGVDGLGVHKQTPIDVQPALHSTGDPALEGPTGSWLNRPLYQDTRVTAAAAAAFLNDFIIR